MSDQKPPTLNDELFWDDGSWEEFPAFLRDPGSTTQKFRTMVSDKMEIDVRFQGWSQATHEENSFLKVQQSLPASLLCGSMFVREVYMLGDGVPWLFARTLFPEKMLHAFPNVFENLGTRPLGEVIFNLKGVTREPFYFARITQQQAQRFFCISLTHLSPNGLWMRRSLFRTTEDCFFLMTEIFLPDFPCC